MDKATKWAFFATTVFAILFSSANPSIAKITYLMVVISVLMIISSIYSNYFSHREVGYKEEEKAMVAQKEVASTMRKEEDAEEKLIRRENYVMELAKREELIDLNEKQIIEDNGYLIEDIIQNRNVNSFYKLGRNIFELKKRVEEENKRLEGVLHSLEIKEKIFLKKLIEKEKRDIITELLAKHGIERDKSHVGEQILKDEKKELKHLKQSIDIKREVNDLEKEKLRYERKKRDLTKKMLKLLDEQHESVNTIVNKRKFGILGRELKKIRERNTTLLTEIREKIDIEQRIIYLDKQIKNLILEDKLIEDKVLTDVKILKGEISKREES
jgi:hypothetical protein